MQLRIPECFFYHFNSVPNPPLTSSFSFFLARTFFSLPLPRSSSLSPASEFILPGMIFRYVSNRRHFCRVVGSSVPQSLKKSLLYRSFYDFVGALKLRSRSLQFFPNQDEVTHLQNWEESSVSLIEASLHPVLISFYLHITLSALLEIKLYCNLKCTVSREQRSSPRVRKKRATS